MDLGGRNLRQRDGVSCGPTVAVVAGALLDPAYAARMEPGWFDAEQARVHRAINRIWPRRLGTTPVGLARAVNAHSAVRYRWRLFRGRRDALADVFAQVRGGRPVAMLIGNVVPRHWVLIVAVRNGEVHCYEPSSGAVRTVTPAALRQGRLTGLGFPRVFAFVLPRDGSRARCDR